MAARSHSAFAIDPMLFRSFRVRPYPAGRAEAPRPLRVFARDPTTARLDGAVVELQVPFEPLKQGPTGCLFRVEDRDDTTGLLFEGVDLEDGAILRRRGLDPSTADPRFGQQMVYAVCSTIYDRFRRALGRDPSWGFQRHDDEAVLILRPHAARDQNAWYDPEKGELAFGYYKARRDAAGRNQDESHVFTCLSHDIVVHETSHALLDGMRQLFKLETQPDVSAFHEGFSDLVAIFQRFSYRDHVELAIDRGQGRLDDRLLIDVASQFGQTAAGGGESALRSAIPAGESLETPSAQLLTYDSESHDAHSLGSVLVAAVFEAYRTVYRRKTQDLLRLAGTLRPDSGPGYGPLPEALVRRLAREAGTLAEQFLNIVIRAVDYCPPVDLTFGEYLRAMITADADLVPDDPWAYREALVDAFRRRRVRVDDVPDLSEESLKWHPPDRSLEPVEGLLFSQRTFDLAPSRAPSEAELNRQARALGRFVCRPDHMWYFGLIEDGKTVLRGDGVGPPTIQSLRSVQRVGPDGQLAFDLVAEVVQKRTHASGVQLFGGATVIIGPDGRIRYTICKNTGSNRRLDEFLQYRRAAGHSNDSEFFRSLCQRR